MKTLKMMFVFFLAMSISFAGFAQEKKNKKYYKKELSTLMDDLTKEQQMSILTFATQNKESDPKKEVLKMLKKMSPEQMEKVLAFSQQTVKMTALKKEQAGKIAQTKMQTKSKGKAQYKPVSKESDLKKVAKPVAKTMTTMEVTNAEYDFGVISQGEKVSFEYIVKNTGTEPLIISKAKGSCGCTVPKWPKEPIAPGASAEIKVTFDSKGKKGKQRKRVTITANTEPAQTYLTLAGEILVDQAPKKNK